MIHACRCLAIPVVTLMCLCACTKHEIDVKPIQTSHEIEVKPIKIEPIYMTIDVNIRIQRELDNFFAFEEKKS